MNGLEWPEERARRDEVPVFAQPASNVCLDFHGDPVRAKLVVFADGNHHMALGECLERFLAANPGAGDVFYATTPPRVIVEALRAGRVRVGNYAETLKRLARRAGVTLRFLEGGAAAVLYGESIHHREAPQAVAGGRADAAIVFSHLALRYTRIFPGRFDVVPLAAQGDPDNLSGETHAALVADGGAWGHSALEFLTGPDGAAIYARHGLEPLATSRK